MPLESNVEEKPLVVLLHAWPLEGVPNLVQGAAAVEVLDVERDAERQEAMRALHATQLGGSLKCLSLTRKNLLEAFAVARIVLIGTHGTVSGGLVFEKEDEIGGAEVLSPEDIMTMFSNAKCPIETRMVFVGACHSEAVGHTFQKLGVDHVVAITGGERVSNLASRAFFSRFLEAALNREPIEEAVEKGIKAVEKHPQISEERRKFQRQKFSLIPRKDGRTGIFDANEFLPRGEARDLTETSELFGFSENRDWPWRLIGRNELVLSLIRDLRKRKKLLVIQSSLERGLGSSAVLHFLAKYVSERECFQCISLQTSLDAARSMLLDDEEDAPNRLVIIDPNLNLPQDANAAFFEAVNRSRSHVIAVIRSTSSSTAGGLHRVQMPGLETFHAEQLQRMLREEMGLQLSFVSADTNPRKIIQRTKADALKQSPKWIALIDSVRMDPSKWRPFLEQLFRECVTGPQPWPRRDLRGLEDDEIEFIKARMQSYRTPEDFWVKWLEPTMATLGTLEPYWTNRSLMALVSEEDTAARVLKGQEPWTFLFRCSVREPGKVTLSYLTDSGRVEKSLFTVKRWDGSVEMKFEDGPVTGSNLWEAVKTLGKLKKVMIRFGKEITALHKVEAFTDAY